jgi:hypothetical protein
VADECRFNSARECGATKEVNTTGSEWIRAQEGPREGQGGGQAGIDSAPPSVCWDTISVRVAARAAVDKGKWNRAQLYPKVCSDPIVTGVQGQRSSSERGR